MEGHKQVHQAADTRNSGVHRVNLKVGRSLVSHQLMQGPTGARKGLVVSRELKPVHVMLRGQNQQDLVTSWMWESKNKVISSW